MNRVFLLKHESINFIFSQNRNDFIVDELFDKEFAKKGTFLILHVKKVNLTTWELIDIIASYLSISTSQIGYAGLKDKYATTTQYLSLPQSYERQLKKFYHKQIQILETFKSKKKISIGDLSANKFTVTLRDVDSIKAGKIDKIANKLQKVGFPNYFGYQRFSDDSIKQARQMIDGDIFIKDKKVSKFLISVYQSYKFNQWLSQRVQMSIDDGLDYFKLLSGDVMTDGCGKVFTPKSPLLKEFLSKSVTPTGLLAGRRVFRARGDARQIEELYDDEFLDAKGLRRDAWIYPRELNCKYTPATFSMRLDFILPKASYATVFIENIANKQHI